MFKNIFFICSMGFLVNVAFATCQEDYVNLQNAMNNTTRGLEGNHCNMYLFGVVSTSYTPQTKTVNGSTICSAIAWGAQSYNAYSENQSWITWQMNKWQTLTCLNPA